MVLMLLDQIEDVVSAEIKVQQSDCSADLHPC